MRRCVTILVVMGLILAGWVPPGAAQSRPLSFIRDAEIEDTIGTFAEPILRNAGLNPRSVDVFLVDEQSLNAFVAGGQNMFLHTGLLMAARDPGELIGVIAHESGHIAGGHLARGQEALEQASRTALIGSLLGLAAAVASGSGGAGAAAISGSNTLAQRNFLAYTRTMESAADQAALSYLDRAGMSSEGLLTFLETLSGQELVPVSRQVEYVRTHPLTMDRIDAVRRHVEQSPYTGAPMPAGFVERFDRMQAKLTGFLRPHLVARDYPAGDTSVAARYARAIAAYRQGDVDASLAGIDALIAEEPSNPYFHELRGQILLENGRLAEARPAYQRAVELEPDEPLLLIALAQTKIDAGGPDDLDSAIDDLTSAVQNGGGTPFAWRLLATAYGRRGDMGLSAMALAEEALAQGDREAALEQTRRAEQLLPTGSPGWLRVQDVRRAAEELEEG